MVCIVFNTPIGAKTDKMMLFQGRFLKISSSRQNTAEFKR